MYHLLFSALLVTAGMSSFAQSTTWKADLNHSRLTFTVTHQGINSIAGLFKEYAVTVTSSKADFSDAAITLTVAVASIDTEIPARDNHLRSKDYFDVARYPEIRFQSTDIRNTTGVKGRHTVSGNLTLHGVTKTVTIELWHRGTIADPATQKIKAGFQVTAVINRTDFGVGFPDPFDISTEVHIRADGEFIRS